MSCTIPASPFDLTLNMGSAPSWPFTATDDSTDPEEALSLASAAIWFAVKAAATDADADALIFASTANGKVVITSAADGEFQVTLDEDDTAATASFYAGQRYPAFIKFQLSTGETRVKSGWVTTLVEGIEAP